MILPDMSASAPVIRKGGSSRSLCTLIISMVLNRAYIFSGGLNRYERIAKRGVSLSVSVWVSEPAYLAAARPQAHDLPSDAQAYFL